MADDDDDNRNDGDDDNGGLGWLGLALLGLAWFRSVWLGFALGLPMNFNGSHRTAGAHQTNEWLIPQCTAGARQSKEWLAPPFIFLLFDCPHRAVWIHFRLFPYSTPTLSSGQGDVQES